MNNRYLYKALRVDNGEWAEGNLVFNAFDGTSKNIEVGIRVKSGMHYNYPVEVVPETICHCLGTTDKTNRVLIFEGDILKREYEHWDDRRFPETTYHEETIFIIYREGEWRLVCWDTGGKPKSKTFYSESQNIYKINNQCTILGNIHDEEKII